MGSARSAVMTSASATTNTPVRDGDFAASASSISKVSTQRQSAPPQGTETEVWENSITDRSAQQQLTTPTEDADRLSSSSNSATVVFSASQRLLGTETSSGNCLQSLTPSP